MSEMLELLFRITEVSAVVTILAFIAQYTLLARWWKNPVGRSLVVSEILIILVLLPPLANAFFHFSYHASQIAAWVDLGFFAAVPLSMLWRMVVWERIRRRIKRGKADDDFGLD